MAKRKSINDLRQYAQAATSQAVETPAEHQAKNDRWAAAGINRTPAPLATAAPRNSMGLSRINRNDEEAAAARQRYWQWFDNVANGYNARMPGAPADPHYVTGTYGERYHPMVPSTVPGVDLSVVAPPRSEAERMADLQSTQDNVWNRINSLNTRAATGDRDADAGSNFLANLYGLTPPDGVNGPYTYTSTAWGAAPKIGVRWRESAQPSQVSGPNGNPLPPEQVAAMAGANAANQMGTEAFHNARVGEMRNRMAMRRMGRMADPRWQAVMQNAQAKSDMRKVRLGRLSPQEAAMRMMGRSNLDPNSPLALTMMLGRAGAANVLAGRERGSAEARAQQMQAESLKQQNLMQWYMLYLQTKETDPDAAADIKARIDAQIGNAPPLVPQQDNGSQQIPQLPVDSQGNVQPGAKKSMLDEAVRTGNFNPYIEATRGAMSSFWDMFSGVKYKDTQHARMRAMDDLLAELDDRMKSASTAQAGKIASYIATIKKQLQDARDAAKRSRDDARARSVEENPFGSLEGYSGAVF